jgi:hypothetical protein
MMRSARRHTFPCRLGYQMSCFDSFSALSRFFSKCTSDRAKRWVENREGEIAAKMEMPNGPVMKGSRDFPAPRSRIRRYVKPKKNEKKKR